MTDEQSEIVEAYTNILKKKNLRPSTALNCMEAMTSLREGLIELSNYDEGTIRKMHDVADELGEILGHTVDEDRMDLEDKEKLDEKVVEITNLLRELRGEEE